MAISITDAFGAPSHDKRKYIVNFYGTSIITTVTASPSVVRKWLQSVLYFRRYLRNRLIVGLGVQWHPYSTEAATIQLCVGRNCLIFQLIHSDTVPKLLRRFLLLPSNTFVGMWNNSDGRKLLTSKHELQLLRQPVDLRRHAKSRNIGGSLVQASREDIVEECLGYRVRFDTEINTSDWDDFVLNRKQVAQATVDAYASFLIGKNLQAWKL